MKKIIFLAIPLFIALGVFAITAKKSLAQEASIRQDPVSSLVQKIADKFNLNKDEVQAVFDVDREERRVQRKAGYETWLSNQVTDGKITNAQKDLIVAKRNELESQRQQNREEHQSLSLEERQQLMEQKRTELESWAQENGIDVQYLQGFGGKGHGPSKGLSGNGFGPIN